MARVKNPADCNRPVVLLAASLWWPLSARLAMRFLEYGCRVAALCPKGHYLHFVDGIDEFFPYRRLGSLASLESAIREANPDIVIPCDDRVTWQLHELHRSVPDLHALIEASLGSASEYELIGRREKFLETAQSLGILTPATRRVRSEEEVQGWFARDGSAAVVKLDGTWGGEGVAIVRSEEQAKAAFRQFSRKSGLLTSWKRMLINRDPLTFWRRKAEPSIILQHWIEGRPANSMIACWRGEVLAMVSVEVLASQGATGAAFLVRVTENDQMAKAAYLLANRLQWSGFFGLDYLIHSRTGLPYLIEVNPRCTQLGHLPLQGKRDLVGALCTKLSGRACSTDATPVTGKVVAFFPQAQHWGRKKALPFDVVRDIPQNQPKLMDELMRPTWPERRWISRIYHYFSPLHKAEPVEFCLDADQPTFPAYEAGGWAGGQSIAKELRASK